VSRWSEWRSRKFTAAKLKVDAMAAAGEIEGVGDSMWGTHVPDVEVSKEEIDREEVRDIGEIDDVQEHLLFAGLWDDEQGLQQLERRLQKSRKINSAEFRLENGYADDHAVVMELLDIAEHETIVSRCVSFSSSSSSSSSSSCS
jgi:hypothetical protein